MSCSDVSLDVLGETFVVSRLLSVSGGVSSRWVEACGVELGSEMAMFDSCGDSVSVASTSAASGVSFAFAFLSLFFTFALEASLVFVTVRVEGLASFSCFSWVLLVCFFLDSLAVAFSFASCSRISPT